MFAASALLGPRKKTAVKHMPYESGMDPIGDARQRFDVRYYTPIPDLLEALLQSYRDWGGTERPPRVAIVDWRCCV